MTGIAVRAVALVVALLLGFPARAGAADANPLRPVDMSSPRATLEGFVASLDSAYAGSNAVIAGYAASSRLYLTADERQRLASVRNGALSAVQSLDTSRISPVLRTIVAIERAIQLKEILDRIGLPPVDTIPDRDAMARASAKRWRLPNTEIDLVLIEEGPRAGDYLVSADTVERLPEFYERVKDLPYLPGPARQLSETYRAMSGNRTATIFEIISNSPIGLDRIIPPRWMVSLPAWAKFRAAGVAVWQWLGLVFGLLAGALFVYGSYRLARRLARRREDTASRGWDSLLTPLAIAIVAFLIVPLLSLVLRIGGSPRAVVAFTQTIAVFASVAWISVVAAGVLGETIAASEHLTRGSLDSQLIRLGTRFVGLVLAIGLLLECANELGFPAYSVLAGLGIGGLAIALAARDSLANLLGSVLIMLEKPFRVGHVIRLTGTEGTVEEVGFRSTRIRTAENSLISIPNNTVVNASVENLSLRLRRRQRFLVQLTCDTPPAKMEAFARGVERLLTDHPATAKENIVVRFNDLGESSLNILVMFHLVADTFADELQAREEILYQIMASAKALKVEFAFPTRTLHVETMPAPPSPANSRRGKEKPAGETQLASL
jgi:MscS family membrane protein